MFAIDCDFCDYLRMPDLDSADSGVVPDMTLVSHIFLYAFPLTAVLTIGCAFETFCKPRMLTTFPFWIWLASLITTLIIIACGLRHIEHLRSDRKNYSQAFWTCGAYFAGLIVALVVRLAKGPLNLTTFYQQGIPVVAAFVVAIVFQQTRRSDRNKPGIRTREVTVVYILTGAVCPMFDLFPGHGFSYLVLYAVICGSLGSSCYAVVRAALNPSG
jgi:hypothetical protein